MTTPTIVVGTNSWITLADAEIYMLGRLGASKFWNTAADKTAALITAYRQLSSCEKWEIPADVSENMEIAQCEMALYLLQHLEDSDTRAGLQAQGVTAAGIVQETYNANAKDELPIPAIVKELLEDYEVNESIGIVRLHRHSHRHEC
jgi:hypothetical protein